MTISAVDQLVADYLARLDRAASILPSGRRSELLEEIREHIDSARAAGAAADEAAVRTMLDRLGEPEEIVDAAREEQPSAEPMGVATQPRTGLELAAVLLLTVGSFVPLAGWAVGAVLLWNSRRWSNREKLLGTLVVPGGPALALWSAVFTPGRSCVTMTDSSGTIVEESCTGFALPSWLGVPLLVAVLVAPFVVAGVLLSRARTRAAAEPPVVRPAGEVRASASAWSGYEIVAVLLLAVAGLLVFLGLFLIGVIPLLAGLALTWGSKLWSRQERLTSTVIAAAVPAVLVAVLGLVTSEFDSDRVYRGLNFGLGLGAAAAAVYLTVLLNRRRT